MRQCRQCGATFLKGETLCAYCGEPLVHGAKQKEQKYKRPNPKANEGAKQKQSQGFSAEQRQAYRSKEKAPPIKMFEPNRKENLIAGVLAFALGNFGMHWFYLGNNKRGVLYLAFFWTLVPMFLGFIDGVRLLRNATRIDL